jgi:peptidoglycan/xylan/chitin deacetylase (PgdA/CDA1 family)
MSKKSLLADILFRRLKYVTVPICNAFRPKLLYVLAYHRVFPPPGADYPFLDGIVSASPESFEEQLRFVKKRFNVINFNDLSDLLSSAENVPDNALVITFDDGYADNYDIAFKILKSFGLTATMFVSTSFVDSGQPLWFDKSAYIIKAVSEGTISFDSGRYKFEVTDENREEIIGSVRDLFVSHSNEDRLRWLGELENQSGVSIKPEHTELVKSLNWDKIREMSDGGIEIGSHTVTHPYLTKLTNEAMRFELSESKRAIEENTGKQVKSVAYPAGAFDRRVQECAKDCGYEFGISYKHEVTKLMEDNTFAIPRIHVETDVDFPLFQANLLFPRLFVR